MGGSTTTKSTQTRTGTPEQTRNIAELQNSAYDYFQTGGPQYYGGNAVAGIDPATQSAWERMLALSTGAGAQGIDQAINTNAMYLDPNFVKDPTSAPGYEAMAGDLQRRAVQGFLEGVAPELRGGAILNGQYGGSKQGIAEGLGAARIQDQFAGQLGGLQQQVWQQMLAAQQNAIGRAPGLYQAGLMPAQTEMAVGDMRRQYEQQLIDEAIRKWNFEQQAPIVNMMLLKDLTGSVGQYGDTTTSKSKTTQQPGAAQMLGSALALGSMFTPFGAAAAGLGGVGGGGAPLIGGALGMPQINPGPLNIPPAPVYNF